jgi:hypothetical protein
MLVKNFGFSVGRRFFHPLSHANHKATSFHWPSLALSPAGLARTRPAETRRSIQLPTNDGQQSVIPISEIVRDDTRRPLVFLRFPNRCNVCCAVLELVPDLVDMYDSGVDKDIPASA